MECKNYEDNSEKQCGIVYINSNGFLVIQCIFCEERYESFDEYAQHLAQEHINSNVKNDSLTELLNSNKDSENVVFTTDPDSSILIERYVEEFKDGNKMRTIRLERESSSSVDYHEYFTNENEDNIAEGAPKKEKSINQSHNKSKSNHKADVSILKLTPAMRRRLKRETEGNIYKCLECSFSCNDKSNLMGHIKRHSSNKPYDCTECSKGFYTRTELKAHQRSHSGERPFLCSDCGKAFITSSKLTLHVKRHSNQRDKQCPICDARFYCSTRLRDHLIIHSQKRPFKCNICSATFKSYPALKNHDKLHENKRKYKCPLCAASFNQNPGLYSHMKTQHSLATQ